MHKSLSQSPNPLDGDALTVAMAVAPGVYARNRFFRLFQEPEVRRAKARAALLRGIVEHLRRVSKPEADGAIRVDRMGGRALVSYRMPGLHFSRRAELTDLELECLRFLAARAGVAGVPGEVDKEALLAALRRLAGAE